MTGPTPVRRRAPAERELDLESRVSKVLHRHPAVGLAVGVLRDGRFEFVGHGFADLVAATPVTEDTVFRIGSVTKTMTAIAVMQLWEEGLVDLDAPASDYLRAYGLVLRRHSFRRPTLRHLLTHTSGIPDVRHFKDLLHFDWGPWDARPPVHSVRFGEPLPSLADHYRDGLEVVADPGSAFSYSNPAFATLGQIVEDVSGMSLDRYVRERVFEPLGMVDTDLVRSPRIAARLAIGYTFGRTGPRPVPDRDWIGAGGGGVYSTPRDLARYAAALLDGGANEHGRVLKAETLAAMFDGHYRTAPGLPAMGLAFFRTELAGRRILGHDGILPGFNAALAVVPDDGVGVILCTNGSSGAMRWIPGEVDRLLRGLLDLPEEEIPAEVPHHPEVWLDICGRYGLPPRIGDLRGRLAMGGGLEVFVCRGRPLLRLRMPVPTLWRGLPLQPDDPDDPYAFRLDLSVLGMGGVRLRFRKEPGTGRRVIHTDLAAQPISFEERHPAAPASAPIDRLSAEDQLMLGASRAWPQDIGALAILDGRGLVDGHGRFRMDTVRQLVASRLHLVPRFRQVIRTPRRGRGDPYWADAPAFDLARHVRESRLEPPAGEAELLRAVEELRAQRFERRHPLWAIWFLSGLPDGKVAMFVKIHHTVADGLAAMTILSAFLDFVPDVAHPPPLPWTARPAPRPSQLVADHLQQRISTIGRGVKHLARPWSVLAKGRALLPATRELLADAPGDPTSIDRMVGPARRLALVRESYRTVRRIGRTYGASVNDILLAVTAAGLRRLLMARGEPVEGITVRAYVPVSLRRRIRGPQQGTYIAQMAVPLSLSEAAPVERLRRIAAETRRRKARRRPSLGSLFRGRLIRRVMLRLVVAQRVNLTTASIPGPRRPAYLAGAPVLEVFPVLPLIANEPLGVGAVAYAGTIGIGIAVDRDAVPDLEVLATGVREELAALAVAADLAANSQRAGAPASAEVLSDERP